MDLLPNILLPIMVPGDTSEVEKESNYLGVFFSRSVSFCKPRDIYVPKLKRL